MKFLYRGDGVDIQTFIDKRKKLGLSQKELSNGICTQATLSKFENNGKIPSLKILIQLCNRLDLSLDSIIGVSDNKSQQVIKQMNKAEFNLIIQEYEDSWEIIKSIDPKDLADDRDAMMQYYYLKGYLNVLDDGDLFDAVFDFNRILSELDGRGETIFTFLSFVGMGMVYAKQGDDQKSEYYFSKVFSNIYTMSIDDVNKIWRYINIIFYCAIYYSERNDLETANALLKYGVKICAQNHVTYYIARIYAQLAMNESRVNGNNKKVRNFMNKALVFSEFNQNEKEIALIKRWVASNKL
ncbi:helix-turn-helix transcriptional regulator [Companilactobacillus pabuli]|jgi:transcriptional regulator with XRE-family HTH domain|uniref:Helix-turn-helix transcriptional regulator n=1 Tax=Companilactobacillus pabuli TaxID=2714036 RepID=A0A7L7KZI0_9LACO|nr:helix-turn-helix transcriptional regulator [Companilactobacillus pabuli]AKP02545.1 Cro/Cl family transcriptional regulator [Companilactobacillus farciminis]AKS50843.1 Cro/Cl family transcriptional regulator [Companilactobacillus farciminis]MDG5113972.1 helix-turn-helix transcriptional regulator [Companilactobacillus pabuli]QMT84726.1 helix-turn-helix transcriptional regulator [Companilactobacillus pabuli]